MIERCEKCGKPFMDKSEVNRHKMYEHIVPVSPFEENKEGTTTIYESMNAEKKVTGNRNNHPEELQKLISTTTTTSTIVDTTNKIENNNNDSNNYTKGINITQNRSRGLRSFRL